MHTSHTHANKLTYTLKKTNIVAFGVNSPHLIQCKLTNRALGRFPFIVTTSNYRRQFGERQ